MTQVQTAIYLVDAQPKGLEASWPKVRDQLASNLYTASLVQYKHDTYALILADMYCPKMPGIYVSLIPALIFECRSRLKVEFKFIPKNTRESCSLLKVAHLQIKLTGKPVKDFISPLRRSLESVCGQA